MICMVNGAVTPWFILGYIHLYECQIGLIQYSVYVSINRPHCNEGGTHRPQPGKRYGLTLPFHTEFCSVNV